MPCVAYHQFPPSFTVIILYESLPVWFDTAVEEQLGYAVIGQCKQLGKKLEQMLF